MIHKRLLITLLLLTTAYLNAYSQKIEIRVIGNDTLFVADRGYAEYVALKFDSLATIKVKNIDCKQIVTEQSALIDDYKDILNIKDDIIKSYVIESVALMQKVESYERIEVINTDIQKKLNQTSRKKNFWKVTGIVGIGTSALLTTLFLLKS